MNTAPTIATLTLTGVTSFPGSSSIDASGIGTFASTTGVSGTSAGGYTEFHVNNLSATGFADIQLNVGPAAANGTAGIYYRPGVSLGFGVIANDTTAPMTFSTNNGQTRMTIDSSGNVGIGRAPTAFLDVYNSTIAGTTAGSNTIALISSNGSGRDASLKFGDNVNASAQISYVSGNLYFRTNSATAMTIDTAGKVAVGGATSQTFTVNHATAPIISVSRGGSDIGFISNGATVFGGAGNTDFGIDANGGGNLLLGASGTLGMTIAPSGKVTTGSDIQISGGSVVSAGAGTNNPAVMIRNTAPATIIATNITATWTFPTFIGGIIMVTDTTDAFAALFFISGSGGILKISDPSGGFSTIINNAATVNVTYVGSTGVLSVQNRLAATKGFLVTLLASS